MTAVVLSLLVIIIIIVWRYCVYESPQMKFVQNMGNGINTGNTLDAYGMRTYHPEAGDLEFETYWNNPKITEELLAMIKSEGFQTVRIPVTWQDHMDENGRVSEEWMDRVQEVVDMALEQELYVILNTHHEEWMNLEVDRKDEILERFAFLWTQIAERFADYGDRLLFEGMNEPRLRDSEYEWKAGTEELRAMVNELNACFVDTVRSTGGLNAERFLLICPYANNSIEEAMEGLEIPKGNIIVSIHMYVPYTFCQKEDGMVNWDMTTEECAGYAEDIVDTFAAMQRLWIRKGIPVILTEYGARDKNNLDSRIQWLQIYKTQADKAGIPCIWWDNGSDYQLMDRENYKWVYPELTAVCVE